MANEKKKEGFIETILKGKGSYFIYDASRKFFDSLFDSVRQNVNSTIRFATKYLGSYIFFIAGILFVLISIVLLLKEYFNISYGWSMMLFGLVLLIVSLFMRLDIEKNKR